MGPLRRADGLFIVADLSDAPLAQIENTLAQLDNMRIDSREKKTLIIGNKIDSDNTRENYTALNNKYGGQLSTVAISAQTGIGLEELKRETYKAGRLEPHY